MGNQIFETKRMLLRPLALADEERLYQVFSDEYARTFYPEMVDTVNVRKWIGWNLGNYEKCGFGLWALELKDSGAFIGDCGLTYQDVEGTNELEIGYHILLSQRRLGYATEAALACLDYGFRNTSSRMICSVVRPANQASCAAAGRIHSARREFVNREHPALLFYTNRPDWESRPRDFFAPLR